MCVCFDVHASVHLMHRMFLILHASGFSKWKDNKWSVVVASNKVDNAELGGPGPRLSIGLTRQVVSQWRR